MVYKDRNWMPYGEWNYAADVVGRLQARHNYLYNRYAYQRSRLRRYGYSVPRNYRASFRNDMKRYFRDSDIPEDFVDFYVNNV